METASSSTTQVELQPHPDPRLAALGRINPTPGNPKGYPPYDLMKVTGYTNNQLLYYLQTHQITDLEAFQKAQRTRDEILRGFDRDGESDEGADGNGSAPRSSKSISREPRLNQGNRQRSLTLDEDSEPDDDFPQPDPSDKGLKIDKISHLRRDGGPLNYKMWLNELKSVYELDRARYSTAAERIAFASSQFDDKMGALWINQSQLRPHLRSHWRKFLRWVEQTHLHSEADRYKYLKQFHEATQGESEEPIAFYSRLMMLALAINRQIDVDDLFIRLDQNLQNVLTRYQRKGKTVEELLGHAQEVWSTLKPRTAKRKRGEKAAESIHGSSQKEVMRQDFLERGPHPVGQARKGSSRGKIGMYPTIGYNELKREYLSNEEYVRRRENSLCLRCGKPGHFVAKCPSGQPSNPLANGPMNTMNIEPPKGPQAASQRGNSRGSHKRNKTTRAQAITIRPESPAVKSEVDRYDVDLPSAAELPKDG